MIEIEHGLSHARANPLSPSSHTQTQLNDYYALIYNDATLFMIARVYERSSHTNGYSLVELTWENIPKLFYIADDVTRPPRTSLRNKYIILSQKKIKVGVQSYFSQDRGLCMAKSSKLNRMLPPHSLCFLFECQFFALTYC